jgi:hypothetical protein
MEAASINTGGTGFFKLMVDTPENGNTINPTWQVDQIEIVQDNMVPEIITVAVNNTALTASSNTTFDLYYQTITNGIVKTYLCVFALGDSADSFSDKLTDSNMTALWYYNAIVTLETVTDANSAVTDYIYTITIQNYRQTPTIPLTRSAGVRVTATQNHSSPINGTYTLSVGSDLLSVWDPKINNYATNIAFDANPWYIADALNKYYGAT